MTVLGITDNSFAQPYILLSADIGDDAGYFGEKLANARKQLVGSWQRRIEHLQSGFQHTDIVGAFNVNFPVDNQRTNAVNGLQHLVDL